MINLESIEHDHNDLKVLDLVEHARIVQFDKHQTLEPVIILMSPQQITIFCCCKKVFIWKGTDLFLSTMILFSFHSLCLARKAGYT